MRVPPNHFFRLVADPRIDDPLVNVEQRHDRHAETCWKFCSASFAKKASASSNKMISRVRTSLSIRLRI